MCEVCLSGLAGWDNWWEAAFTHVTKKGKYIKVGYKAKSSNEGGGGGVAKRGGPARGFTVKGLGERGATGHVEGNSWEFCRRKNIKGKQRFWTGGAGVRTPRGWVQPKQGE